MLFNKKEYNMRQEHESMKKKKRSVENLKNEGNINFIFFLIAIKDNCAKQKL